MSKNYTVQSDHITISYSIEEIQRLRDEIRYHEKKYYVDNEPEIADGRYDQLVNNLKAVENKYPELITADSPTQRVASDLNPEMDAVPHIVSMLSLDNAYNGDDLKKFDKV